MFHDAITDVVIDLGQDVKAGVQAAVPVSDRTGSHLRGTIALKLFPRKEMAFILAAGRKNKDGYNYGWFTELGTDAAAGHAVDKIGYVHKRTRGASKNKGIAAMHWFSGPTTTVLKDAPEKIAKAIATAAASILHR